MVIRQASQEGRAWKKKNLWRMVAEKMKLILVVGRIRRKNATKCSLGDWDQTWGKRNVILMCHGATGHPEGVWVTPGLHVSRNSQGGRREISKDSDLLEWCLGEEEDWVSTDLQGEGMGQHRRACGAGPRVTVMLKVPNRTFFLPKPNRSFLLLAVAEVSATKTYQEKP